MSADPATPRFRLLGGLPTSGDLDFAQARKYLSKLTVKQWSERRRLFDVRHPFERTAKRYVARIGLEERISEESGSDPTRAALLVGLAEREAQEAIAKPNRALLDSLKEDLFLPDLDVLAKGVDKGLVFEFKGKRFIAIDEESYAAVSGIGEAGTLEVLGLDLSTPYLTGFLLPRGITPDWAAAAQQIEAVTPQNIAQGEERDGVSWAFGLSDQTLTQDLIESCKQEMREGLRRIESALDGSTTDAIAVVAIDAGPMAIFDDTDPALDALWNDGELETAGLALAL